jgi:hypothetical protein
VPVRRWRWPPHSHSRDEPTGIPNAARHTVAFDKIVIHDDSDFDFAEPLLGSDAGEITVYLECVGGP